MESTAGNGGANMNATGAAGSSKGPLHVSMNTNSTASTQLQQRAAAAAQYLNSGGQRQPTSRDVQLMLEKNDDAMRAWTYLHAQQPSKHSISEHKSWSHKCAALRQQIGARLEVLASLADKQIAREDAGGGDKASSAPLVPPTPPPVPSSGSSSSASAAKKLSRAKPTKPKVSASTPAPIQVRQTTASLPGALPSSLPVATASTSLKSTATAAALGFPDAPMPVSGLPLVSQPSTNTAAASYYGGSSVSQRTAPPPTYPSTTAASTTAASTTSNATTNATSAQAFSNTQSYANTTAGYMGGMAQQSGQSNPYMNPASFMMNNAAMNMAASGMMNQQYMAMQMQGQMPMAMNAGAMYNPAMFASTGNGYMNVNNTNQLQANAFNNTPFQMQQGGAAGYNPAFNMSTQMMGQMGGFQPMQSAQMMFNPMAFNMTQQPQQQQHFQGSQMQSSSFSNNATTNLASQPQQSSQQPGGMASAAPSQTGTSSSPFLDDDNNIFEGFSDDAFLTME